MPPFPPKNQNQERSGDKKVSACPLCRKKRVKEIKIGQELYRFCFFCELIYSDPENHISPQEEKARYLEHDNNLANEGYVNMFKDFIKRGVKPFIKGVGQAIDYGCGPEPVLGELLKREGFKVHLFDPIFFPADISNWRADLITCTEVLEHMARPREFWENIGFNLRPGGVLVLMTHFHPGPEGFPEWWYHRDPTHITFYNPHTLNWIEEEFPLQLIFQDAQKLAVFKKE